MSLNDTLCATGVRRDELRRIQAQDHDGGPRMAQSAFSTFQMFRYPNENDLSRMLGWLLNPQGRHGAGSAFLENFLVRLGASWRGLHHWKARVRYEVPTRQITQAARRIDIVVEGSGWILGIENKPSAVDQEGQLSDYIDHLEAMARLRSKDGKPCRFGLVYLSGRGDGPAEHSIGASDLARRQTASQLHLLSYQDLADWVAWCHQRCPDPEARIFIGHLWRHLRYRFLDYKDMSDAKPLLDAVLENSDALRVALDCGRQLARLRWRLIHMLVKQIRGAMPADWEIETHFKGEKCRPRIEILFKDVPHARFAMEFQEHQRFTNLVCGLKWLPNQAYRMPAVTAALNASLGVEKSSDWWPWFTEAGEYNALLPLPRNWEDSDEPWVMINDGQLYPLAIEAAQRVHDALEGAHLLGVDPT